MNTSTFQPPSSSDRKFWSEAVSIESAAEKLGMDEGALRRKCREKWGPKGLAFHLKHPDGGRGKWFIHPAADARLATVATAGSEQLPDLGAYRREDVAIAGQRILAVKEWRSRILNHPKGIGAAEPAFIDEMREKFPEAGINRTNLHNWIKVYMRPADIMKLLPGAQGRRKGGGGDAQAWKAAEDLYCHANQPSKMHVYQAVQTLAAENGWSWCSYDSFRRQLDHRIPPEKQLYHRGRDTWRKQLQPTIPQDPEAWGANERWISDHVQANCWVLYGKTLIRPWITSVMDWRTRTITGHTVAPTPSSESITIAIRHALKDERNFGGPREFICDNGKDYCAYFFHGATKSERRRQIKVEVEPDAFKGIFAILGIDVHFGREFNPNSKARQERWHRALEPFFRSFDTYCGNSTESKPEELAKILKNRFLWPTFEEFAQRFGAFVEGYNASADHQIDDLCDGGERLSPRDALARWTSTKRVMADPNALNLLLARWHKPVYVGRQGVPVAINGVTLHYGNFEVALRPFKALRKEDRRPVYVAYDPADLRTIRVHDEKLRFVCEARLNEMGGGSDPIRMEAVKELIRQKAQYQKSLKHQAEYSLTSILTPEEHLAEIVAAGGTIPSLAITPPQTPAASLDSPREPAALRIIQTPLDGQAKELKREKLKAVVGGAEPAEKKEHIGLTALRKLAEAQQREPARPKEDDGFVDDPWAIMRSRYAGK